jgi:hypothetical protein
MDLIRDELRDARAAGMKARMLIPFTRGLGCAALQFEIELNSLDQLEQFRSRRNGPGIPDKSEWMQAFSAILRSPPSVEIFHIHE